MNDRPSDSQADARHVDEQVADTLLARALRRAWWTILWERLWPALASLAVAIGIFLAVSWAGLWLWLPPMGRAIALFVLVVLIAVAAVPLFRFRLPSTFDGLRRLDRGSGLKHRPATAIADELAAGEQDQVSRRAVARACRAGAARRECAEGRDAAPAPAAVRSDRGARAGGAAGRLDLFRGVRRARQTHHRGVRLGRRGAGEEFPRRCLGDAAGLHRQAAADPARHPRRRAASGRADPDRADRQRAGHPRERREPARSRDQRRHWPRRAAKARRRRPPAPRNTATSSRIAAPRSCAACSTRMSPSRSRRSRIARRRSRSPRSPSRRRAARCSSPTRSRTTTASSARRRPSRSSRRPGPTAACRVRSTARRTSRWCCRRRARATAPARPPRTSPIIPWAGAEVVLTLTARDEAGNEGSSTPTEFKLPERVFVKPLARALIEQRRILALDAEAKPRLLAALDALSIAPEQVHAGAVALSRPALDLLAAHPRQDRRSVARCRGAAVGHGGDDRGRPALRRRSRVARRRRKRCGRRWSAARPTRRSRSSPRSCARRSTSSCRRWPSRCARTRSSSRARSTRTPACCGRRT